MAIEVHFEKHINNLNLIREADARQSREHLAVTLLFGAFLLCLLFYGWQHYQWIQYGYRIEDAQKKMEQSAEMARQLRIERAALRDPGRIDNIARGQLGMVLPAPGQLVTFSADAPLTIPSPQMAQEQEQLAARK
jgi:cell division protein FtsL